MAWSLLESLRPPDRARVLAAARRRSLAPGEVAVREGEPADSLHLLEAGRVAVRVSLPSGDRATLNILRAGDYFGELSLVRRSGPALRSATVVALEPTQTLAISAALFEQLRAENPSLDDLLVTALARRVEQLSRRLLDALYSGADQRLTRCLADLARSYGVTDNTARITLTQDQLADLVGGTRPTVNQVLRRLAEDGLVELGRGRVTVTDVAELARLATRW